MVLLSDPNVPAATVGSVLAGDAPRAPQPSASVDEGSGIQYLLRLRSWSACQRAELYNVGICNERIRSSQVSILLPCNDDGRLRRGLGGRRAQEPLVAQGPMGCRV